MMSVLGQKWQWLVKRSLVVLLIGLSLVSLLACSRSPGSSPSATRPAQSPASSVDLAASQQARSLSPAIAEVSPPIAIQELQLVLNKYQPQVKILSPQADQVLADDMVSVQLQVEDLPLFKNAKLGMGPYLHVILDNDQDQAIYSTEQPLTFSNLVPGTHTIRVFASRPWHESFKNDGAYDQVTFHVFTKTNQNNPTADQPLLTFSQPQGGYGAEPILLDFYLTNAPLHLAAQADASNNLQDWRIRATVNGSSFTLDKWQSIYLQGFKPGKNWVQLELLDQQGRPIENVFNSTTRLVTLEPSGKDTLAKLVRGDLKAADVLGIADPSASVKVPQEPMRSREPVASPAPPAQPTDMPTPEPEVAPPLLEIPEAPLPSPTPRIEVMEPQPAVTTTPTPTPVAPQPEATPGLLNSPAPTPSAKPRRLRNYFQRSTSPSSTTTPSPATTQSEAAPPEVLSSPSVERAPSAEPAEAPTEPSAATSSQGTPEPTAGSTPQVQPAETPQRLNVPSPTSTIEVDGETEVKETRRDLKQVFLPQLGVPEEVPLIQVSPSPALPSRYRTRSVAPTPQTDPEGQPNAPLEETASNEEAGEVTSD